MTTQEFKFNYMVVATTATLTGDEISFKAGLRKGKAAVASIRHFYVQDLTGGDFEELTVTYDANNKTKKLKLFADKGAPGFHQLADALSELRPEADLRPLPPKEAFGTMGMVDSNVWGMWIGIGLILSVMLVGFYPFAHHGFDGGHQDITLRNLAQGVPVSSRNLTITQFEECLDETVISETTHKGSTTTKYLVPLVPTGETCAGSEIRVVLETDELDQSEVDELLEATSIDGILKNIWWEGLGSDEREYFNTEMGVSVPEDALLVEYQGDPAFYRLMFLLIFGSVGGLLGIIAVVIRIQEKKRRAQ